MRTLDLTSEPFSEIRDRLSRVSGAFPRGVRFDADCFSASRPFNGGRLTVKISFPLFKGRDESQNLLPRAIPIELKRVTRGGSSWSPHLAWANTAEFPVKLELEPIIEQRPDLQEIRATPFLAAAIESLYAKLTAQLVPLFAPVEPEEMYRVTGYDG
jgi:hypothetical protein